jgi:hypothetical protein
MSRKEVLVGIGEASHLHGGAVAKCPIEGRPIGKSILKRN